MFEVEPMVKVRVLCPRNRLDDVVEALYEFGSIHVTRSKAFQPGQPSPKLESVSPMLVKLRAMESSLALNHEAGNPKGVSLSQTEKEFHSINPSEFDSLFKRKQELESKVSELSSREKELKPFQPLSLDPNKTKDSRVELAVFDIVGNETQALQKAREHGEATLLKTPGQPAKLLVALEKSHAEKTKHALLHYSKESSLPQSSQGYSKEYTEVVKTLSEAKAELFRVNESIRSYASKHGAKISNLKQTLKVEFKKADLPSKFGQSDMMGSAEGWVPQKNSKALEDSLARRLGESVYVEHMHTNEMPPSKLKNPALLKPFEFMIEFFSLPRYKEIDPTFFTALTFPLFFGMILGDLGYGLILLLLGAFFFMKFKKGFFHSIGGMLALSAVSTMVFGVIYAEFFGSETIFGIVPLHPLLSRVEESGINTLFALSVLIGFLHLTLGLLLGVWQGLREKHAKHSLAKLSWILILFGFTALIANSTNLIFTNYLQFTRVLFPPLDIAALILGVIGLAYFEGATQLLEIPSLISNVLSYLRIMALGLSGVALAGIVASIPLNVNSLTSIGGIISFVLFALLVVLGHAVAIVLGLIEAGIQSLRLHYVEFYSKFYKGGGTAFVPLRDD